MNEKAASRVFRRAAEQMLRRYEAPQTADEQAKAESFREFLEFAYQEIKGRLASPTEENSSENMKLAAQGSLFRVAAGLLTYGRLDVVDDIVNYVPPPTAGMRRLAWVLNNLMPMPKELDPLEDIEAVRQWIETHREKLRWDEKAEKFIFV
jgi:hypothetical protein